MLLPRHRADHGAALTTALRHADAVVVHARVADWRPRPGDGHDWAAVLGDDADRRDRLPDAPARNRLAAGRLLLKHLVATVTGRAPEEIRLARDRFRRPYPVGHPVDVNLSHTGDVLLAGLCVRGRIGVDIERADRWLGGRAVAGRLCAEPELAALADLRGAALDRRLVRLWTVKEACAKALGGGLAHDLRSLAFDLDAATGVSPYADLPGGPAAWSVTPLPVGPAHVAAVAHRRVPPDRRADPSRHGRLTS
ncbi:4'-phosphopantetheinyl transferase superfamily protein [Micromonospora sp. R77]|uniref:4'-phosphopantetheinyl transferase family protein n=1 Tax=Micromonospora sp. R77 TaxID=2925836 RepID=UPI001F61B7FC|nr:4'-phosphopantetheinyl transferase superfamily protein [Micromonospora sp. R77]MCI4065583.1 4'-phosphopantetheinyl transferase superfamily protein [Micromonospora sp. R77]